MKTPANANTNVARVVVRTEAEIDEEVLEYFRSHKPRFVKAAAADQLDRVAKVISEPGKPKA